MAEIKELEAKRADLDKEIEVCLLYTSYIQSVEREKEYVVGNHMQDRKRIGHSDP